MIARLSLRIGVLAYLAAILLVPVGLVFWRTFEDGFGPRGLCDDAEREARALPHARARAIAVPLNTIFGVLCALAIVRIDSGARDC